MKATQLFYPENGHTTNRWHSHLRSIHRFYANTCPVFSLYHSAEQGPAAGFLEAAQ